jgi:hypothetical protein
VKTFIHNIIRLADYICSLKSALQISGAFIFIQNRKPGPLDPDLYELVKIFKKRREEKISKENPIVHNLFITSDLPKIFKKNSLFLNC